MRRLFVLESQQFKRWGPFPLITRKLFDAISDPLPTFEWINQSHDGMTLVLIFVFKEAMGSDRSPHFRRVEVHFLERSVNIFCILLKLFNILG